MPSGADLEYQRLLRAAGVTAAGAQGYDGARLSQLSDEASGTYARKRERDPRDFGLTGGMDDSVALQACIDDAGLGGTVVLPDDLTIRYRSSLVLPVGSQGIEIRGSGNKGSILSSDVDVACLTGVSGHGLAIRNLVISNGTAVRTTFDIDLVNPTKSVIEDVEVDLVGHPTGGGGGIRLRKDVGQGGNSFMPQLNRVWIRQGSLVIDGVTDGHFVDGFVWAADTAQAAIHMKNISDGWSFVSVDVVPSDTSGAGYLIDSTNHTKIVGGYCDGSYVGNLTGYGIHAINSGKLFVSGHNFYHLGRSAILLDNTHGCVVEAAGFYRNNKQDGSYPDIDLINSDYNTFLGLSHSQPTDRVNKGLIYREDAGSVHNLYDASVLDQSTGNLYLAGLIQANSGTQGKRNRPGSLWPRPAGVPNVIVPPATQYAIGSTAAWPAVNRAYFHRFNLTEGAVYRYARLRVDAGSGNMQVSVVKLDGLNYTRIMNSGVIACTTGGQAVDMGATYLEAGEYALVVWCDNITATFPLMNGGEPVRTSQLTAEVDIAGGVPASGALTYSCTRALSGLTLTA